MGDNTLVKHARKNRLVLCVMHAKSYSFFHNEACCRVKMSIVGLMVFGIVMACRLCFFAHRVAEK